MKTKNEYLKEQGIDLEKDLDVGTYTKIRFAMEEYAKDYHESEVKKFRLDDVSQQRELLLAFFDELDELPMGLMHYDREKVVEKFIANNCG